MPLQRGASNRVRSQNIREMVRAGYSRSQAAAAAYRQQRQGRRGGR